MDSVREHLTVYLITTADLHRSSALSGSNCRLFVTITAPGEGLPQVLCGPHLLHGTRVESLMLVDVRFVVT